MTAKLEPEHTSEIVLHLRHLVDTPTVHDPYHLIVAILIFAKVNKYGALTTRDVYEISVRLMHKSRLRPFTYSTVLAQLQAMYRGRAVKRNNATTHGWAYTWLIVRED